MLILLEMQTLLTVLTMDISKIVIQYDGRTQHDVNNYNNPIYGRLSTNHSVRVGFDQKAWIT